MASIREQLVKTVYTNILNREPWPHEFDFVAASDHDVVDRVRLMLESQEAARGMSWRIIRDAIPSFDEDKTLVVGLGTQCYTSWALICLKFKAFSLPFDWIFSSPKMVKHAIEDDFAALLNRDHYKQIPFDESKGQSGQQVEHLFYKENFSIHYMFNHHNVMEAPGYEYLVRTTERFRNLGQDGRRLEFLMFTPYADADAAFVEELSEILNARFANSSLRVFRIERPGPVNLLCEEMATSRSTLVSYTPVSDLYGVTFIDPVDDIALLGRAFQLIFPRGTA